MLIRLIIVDPNNAEKLVGGSLIWYQVEKTLKKWDVLSSSWLSSGFDEQIEIKKNPISNIVSATNSLGAQGFVGSVSASGGLHSNVAFEISKAGGGNPDNSAYFLELSLFDTSNGNPPELTGNASDKFFSVSFKCTYRTEQHLLGWHLLRPRGIRLSDCSCSCASSGLVIRFGLGLWVWVAGKSWQLERPIPRNGSPP